MFTKGSIKTLSMLLLAAIVFLTVGMAAPQRVMAAANCWCVDVVLKAYGIREGFCGRGNAKDLGPYLLEQGFFETSNPFKGDIVVFQPAAGFGPAGHTGLVETIQTVGSNWQYSLRQNNGTPQRAPSGNLVIHSGEAVSVSGQARIATSKTSTGTPCFTLYNIDSSGDTIAGTEYTTHVWYENPQNSGATAKPYFDAAWTMNGCYSKFDGRFLCDTKKR